jgi:hypothetical protein
MTSEVKKILKELWVQYWGNLTAAEVADGMAAALILHQGASELEAAKHAGAYLGNIFRSRERLADLLEQAEKTQ